VQTIVYSPRVALFSLLARSWTALQLPTKGAEGPLRAGEAEGQKFLKRTNSLSLMGLDLLFLAARQSDLFNHVHQNVHSIAFVLNLQRP
jgi:hypothetical protein